MATSLRTRPQLDRILPLILLASCAGGEGGDALAIRGAPPLVDVTLEIGLPEVGVPPDGTYHSPEIILGGVALLDFDNDGDLDLFQVRSPLPGPLGARTTNVLYRQESTGRFQDVTREAGLDSPGYGQGVCVGDVDNDGDLDLYVTNYGPDAFYLNDGDGTFTLATESAGFEGDRWSTAASFLDYDGDGFLDLFVVHYLALPPGERCADESDRREYCGPPATSGIPDILYKGNGDGTFVDVTSEAGVVLVDEGERSTGLGVLCTDFTGDGIVDVYVANDMRANHLWVNQGDGTFVEEALLRGIATDEFGHPEASMGVTAADVNTDGLVDLFMTHLWHENNRLYLGSADILFGDGTFASRLSRFDMERTGWGCGFFDLEQDGDLDLVVANGGVRRRPVLEGGPPGFWSEYAEPNHLFLNEDGEYIELHGGPTGFDGAIEVSRGIALGDLDDDGDVDMVVSNVGNGLRVFENRAERRGHWLRVRALAHGRDALGAQVRVHAGGVVRAAPVVTTASYLSGNDPRVSIGLGAAETVDSLEVVWSDGERERFACPGVDREVVLRRGEGQAP